MSVLGSGWRYLMGIQKGLMLYRLVCCTGSCALLLFLLFLGLPTLRNFCRGGDGDGDGVEAVPLLDDVDGVGTCCSTSWLPHGCWVVSLELVVGGCSTVAPSGDWCRDRLGLLSSVPDSSCGRLFLNFSFSASSGSAMHKNESIRD